MTTSILWFRRDLRLADHPALVAAAASADDVVGVFCLDPVLWGRSGAPRRAFLAGALASLHRSMGGALVVRHGDPTEVLPALAGDVGAEQVFATADFGRYGRGRDERVGVTTVGSPYAVPPGSVTTKTGSYFKVFTPYSRAWAAHGWDAPLPPAEVGWRSVAGDELPAAPAVDQDLPEPSEEAAHAALDEFLASRADRYAEVRNDPGADATSHLSPYLKWGQLHPRQLLDRLGRSKGHATFRTELAWRDFYAEVLFRRPDTIATSFNEAMTAMEVDTGPDTDERFAAWAEGRTGYPIVDAGMRQLRGQAWMHNRVRMIVASFLVKDLHLDWSRGAHHFMDLLVDGDTASNHHGWQWTAGTGTDPAPYFRVFNPVAQGKKFDPDGTYVRRWVPELAAVDTAHVHDPWTDPKGQPLGYPPPIVDHAEERAEALRRYEALRR